MAMKKIITLYLLIIFTTSVTAQDNVPSFIEPGKTYAAAIAMAGEIIFKVLEVDQQAGWIFVEANQPVFLDQKKGWLNINQLTAIREYAE